MRLYVKHHGAVVGPLPLERISAAINAGHVQPDAQVSEDRMKWYPVAALQAFLAKQQTAAPPAPILRGKEALQPPAASSAKIADAVDTAASAGCAVSTDSADAAVPLQTKFKFKPRPVPPASTGADSVNSAAAVPSEPLRLKKVEPTASPCLGSVTPATPALPHGQAPDYGQQPPPSAALSDYVHHVEERVQRMEQPWPSERRPTSGKAGVVTAMVLGIVSVVTFLMMLLLNFFAAPVLTFVFGLLIALPTSIAGVIAQRQGYSWSNMARGCLAGEIVLLLVRIVAAGCRAH